MLYTYDPKLVTVIYGGVLITGFADGTFVKVSRNSDTFSLQMGVDGHATRTKSNDNSGKFEVTLSQASPSNPILYALWKIDQMAPLGVGVKPMIVKDLSGSSLHAAPTTWIVKPSDAEYAKEAGSRVWMFETDLMDGLVGTNFPAGV